jgi:hypothetical protein
LVIPALCKSWSCPRCRPAKVAQWRAIIIAGKPNRFITLTTDPKLLPDPAAAVAHLNRSFPILIRDIRKNFGPFEFVRVWEFTEKGYPHIHIVARGGFVPQKWISERWAKLGCGKIVDIRAVGKAKDAARYVAKYLGKSTDETAAALGKIRLINKSRGWTLPNPLLDPVEDMSDFTWKKFKADYGTILSDLASMGCELIERNGLTCRTLLTAPTQRPNRKTVIDCLGLVVLCFPPNST